MDLRTYLLRRGYWVDENGSLFPPLVSRDNISSIHNFDVMEDRAADTIFLVGYPKSGSCWVKYIMYSILLYDHPDIMQQIDKHLRTEFIHTCLEYSSPETGEPNHGELHTIMMRCTQPLIISTNLSCTNAPQKLPTSRNKLVFLVRNPKDVCVAQLKMLLTEKDLQTRTDFEKYANEFIEGRVPFGSWLEHTLSWWKQLKNRTNYLFISYEEVRTDLRATIQKLTKFLSRSLTQEDISNICQKCCLTRVPWNGHGDNNNKKEEFLDSINDGVMNEWKDYFTVSQSEKFDELLKPKLVESGLYSKIHL